MIAPGDATRPRLGAGSFVRLVGPHFGSDPLKQTRGTLDTPAGIRELAVQAGAPRIEARDAAPHRLGAGSFVRLVGPHFGSDPLKQTRGTLDTPAGIRELAVQAGTP